MCTSCTRSEKEETTRVGTYDACGIMECTVAPSCLDVRNCGRSEVWNRTSSRLDLVVLLVQPSDDFFFNFCSTLATLLVACCFQAASACSERAARGTVLQDILAACVNKHLFSMGRICWARELDIPGDAEAMMHPYAIISTVVALDALSPVACWLCM